MPTASRETTAAETASRIEADALAWIESRGERVVELVRTLVSFETPNPPGANEADAQHWVAQHLESLGMSVEMFDALPGRPNVVGRLAGRGGDRSLLFNGHIDVAELRTPEAWTRPSFDGVVEERRPSAGALARLVSDASCSTGQRSLVSTIRAVPAVVGTWVYSRSMPSRSAIPCSASWRSPSRRCVSTASPF